VFAHGAYGTNNVGDEAIFDGLRIHEPQAIQLYINRGRVRECREVYSMLRGPNQFRPEDRLIIGGGGLLYDRPAIEIMLNLAGRVLEVGGVVDLLGIGAENARPEYHDVIISLVNLARTVTVRSTISQEIIRRITGREVERQDDFAFSLKAPPRPPRDPKMFLPTIGVVTTGDPREDLTAIARIIQRYAGSSAPGGRAHFVHIPHSRAYVSPRNNDVVVGHMLWSSIQISVDNRDLFFHMEPFTADPKKVLATYAELDGVVTGRFHGMIFGTLADVPILQTRAHTLKNQSFLEDYKSDKLFAAASDEELPDRFDQFIQRVRAVRANRPEVA